MRVRTVLSINHSTAQHRFGEMQNESKNEGTMRDDLQIFRKELSLLILKNGIRDSFKLHLLGVKLSSHWSPLGVKFKFSDEHPRPFYMGVPPPPRV